MCGFLQQDHSFESSQLSLVAIFNYLFEEQTQITKILLYGNGSCSLCVFTKMTLFKETRDFHRK